MPIEIERRFVIEDPTKFVTRRNPIHITQGYISVEPVVRVRRSENDYCMEEGFYGITTAALTIKGKGTLSRPEYEYPIPEDHAAELLTMARWKIEKNRYRVVYGYHTWEVDEFLGREKNLWIAEIELENENDTFERPTWVGREITNDPRFSNVNLAQFGRPRTDW